MATNNETGVTADVIRLLPDSVANQIAAGEVIQRPASVIKELVENSVDAGAANIEIVIKDAGKTLIQVVDDGKGMSATDARMAFERHATSKIRCADDLFTLHTMGFRGEALPSIAAVSEIELSTRRECDELGSKLIIRASHVDSQEPGMAAKGTNIKVKNLFYNFVARRRFLKKDSIELSHIIHEFERLALVNTDIAFKLSSNGTVLHSLPRLPLKERITSLFGKAIGETLIPIHTETSLVSIDGFISLPSGARQRGHRQFMFVNGRNMRHPYFHKAILSCYENLIPKDYQPHYFINFKVAPDRIDVNIHPQKHEIKFEDEQSIWQILTAAIREALGRYNASSSIEFNNVDAPQIPAFGSNEFTDADLNKLYTPDTANYNPFELYGGSDKQKQQKLDFGNGGTKASSLNSTTRHDTRDFTKGWQEFYSSLEKIKAESTLPSLDKVEELAGDTNLIQFRKKYIVFEDSDGILLIDQHRAHVNILFQRFKSEAVTGEVSTQNLLFPEPLNLDAQEKVMLDSSIEIIESIGFRIERDKSGSDVLAGIPGSLDVANPAAVLRNILNDLIESGTDIEEEAVNRILLTMARSAAIKGGQVLTAEEIRHIVSSLFKIASPVYTPDGLKIIHRLSDERLASLFLN